jgi:AraC family transcriptional activator of pobA
LGEFEAGAVIPRYHLYGEPVGELPVEFVHVEALSDRSELHDWTIDAHTHAGLAQVALFLSGHVRVQFDDSVHPLQAPAAATIPPGVIHAFEFGADSSGFVVMLADGQLDSAPMGGWIRSSLFEHPVALELDADAAMRVDASCRQLLDEQRTIDTAHESMVQWLTQGLLVVLARQVDAHAAAPANPEAARFRAFRQLIETEFARHRSVRWYAARLHISESSLNRMCDEVAGATAFEVVQARLALEARRRLAYTEVPVAVIAGDLGFSDASYFARFFRRRIGRSPSEFRSSFRAVDQQRVLST